jgi:hypothetical protein
MHKGRSAAMVTIALLALLMATIPIMARCLDTGTDASSSTANSCLGCHDGAVAPLVLPGAPASDFGNLDANHPVRVSYELAYARNPLKYVQASLLDSRIVLVKGEVQCISCHAASANGGWVLTISNDRSSLCLSCHRK